ncbi:MAG TPA: DUF2797 domain-containing protein [Prolixibacteraceae bacterium]|nr:DUF2797 domain-containing protein [Prolixibacteraceae bacterium]
MQLEGNILKMRTELATPVNYILPVGQNEIAMNDLIGKDISMNFTGQINCISCGKQTKTSFAQGFCYNCLQTAPEASESVVRPELSKAHLGIARDMEWAEKHDLIDHFVYLAVSSEVKVGVTRNHQIPTRWIDQGASAAIKLACTPNRHIAGIIEVFLKKFYTDKTDWREMLKNQVYNTADLLAEKEKALKLLSSELRKYAEPNNTITNIEYPVIQFPQKINSLSFDKQPTITGKLSGIKGQYLIFADGSVLNIRKHNGYWIQVNY